MRHLVKVLSISAALLASVTTHAAKQIVPIAGQNVLGPSQILAGQRTSKGLVVVFLSAKCPCSDSHIEELKALQKDFPAFEFVGIHSNTDEELEMSKTYFAARNLPFPVIQDARAKLADDFKAYKTPHAFVLKSDGEILYQGGVTDSAHFRRSNRKYLREALENIQSDQKVQTAEGRTLGCVIARSK